MEGINKGNKKSSFDDSTESERRRGSVTSEVEAGDTTVHFTKRTFWNSLLNKTRNKKPDKPNQFLLEVKELHVRQSQNSFLIKEFKLL